MGQSTGRAQTEFPLQAPITKYMPGKRRGQQALSPILESAVDEIAEGAEEAAAPKTKRRGRPSKTNPSTGERHRGPEVMLKSVFSYSDELVYM